MRRSTRLAAIGVAVVLAAGGATAAALTTGTAQAVTTSDSTSALPACPFWAAGITPPPRSDTPFTKPLQTAAAVNFSSRVAAPTLTGSFSNGQVSFTVSRIPGAVAYRIWRDGVAVAWVSDWGQPTLTAVDTAPCKDSYYTIVAMVDNNSTDASFGQLSAPYWLNADGTITQGPGPVPPGTMINMMVTSYNDVAPTATGYHSGLGICAVDPRIIPWGTYFTVPDYGTCFAGDIGTWIQNDTVDVWLPEMQANNWGVQHRTITIIPNPYGSGSTTSPSPRPSTSPSKSASPSPSTSASKSASPSPSTSPSKSPSPTSTGQYAAWVAGHAYAVGDLVSYAGHNYKCLQAHTSMVGWEPPNVPALWQMLS